MRLLLDTITFDAMTRGTIAIPDRAAESIQRADYRAISVVSLWRSGSTHAMASISFVSVSVYTVTTLF